MANHPSLRSTKARLSLLARRSVDHVAWRLKRSRVWLADRLRRGDRTVIMTPPAGLRFGNWLYLWLDAHQRTLAGEPTVVLEVPGMQEWLTVFPELMPLTVARGELRFHDRREWNGTSWRQRFGVDFTRETLDRFIGQVLAPRIPADHSGSLVLNVRRGDFYSDDRLRATYGFDQLSYLREALTFFDDVETIVVVSDDPAWCREHVGDLALSIATSVSFRETDAATAFTTVAGAKRIVGTNSTFTYWAAYVAGVIHPDARVVMPRFHARLSKDPSARQLDPTWTAVDGHF